MATRRGMRRSRQLSTAPGARGTARAYNVARFLTTRGPPCGATRAASAQRVLVRARSAATGAGRPRAECDCNRACSSAETLAANARSRPSPRGGSITNSSRTARRSSLRQARAARRRFRWRVRAEGSHIAWGRLTVWPRVQDPGVAIVRAVRGRIGRRRTSRYPPRVDSSARPAATAISRGRGRPGSCAARCGHRVRSRSRGRSACDRDRDGVPGRWRASRRRSCDRRGASGSS